MRPNDGLSLSVYGLAKVLQWGVVFDVVEPRYHLLKLFGLGFRLVSSHGRSFGFLGVDKVSDTAWASASLP